MFKVNSNTYMNSAAKDGRHTACRHLWKSLSNHLLSTKLNEQTSVATYNKGAQEVIRLVQENHYTKAPATTNPREGEKM